MNLKRFGRVLLGQALGVGTTLAIEALSQAPWPEAIKFPLGAMLGAAVNAAAKGLREEAKWEGKKDAPILARIF